MNLSKTICSLSLVAAITGLPTAVMAGGDSANEQALYEPSNTADPLRQLLNSPVIDSSGQRLGRVKDAAIDRDTGSIAYYVVSSSNGDKVVPPEAVVVKARQEVNIRRDLLVSQGRISRIMAGGRVKRVIVIPETPDTGDRSAYREAKVLALNVSPKDFRNAPDYQSDNLALQGRDSNMSRVHAFYGTTPDLESTAGGLVATSSEGTTQELTPTGRSERGRTPDLSLAKTFIGRTVEDRNGDVIGEISDIVADLSGQAGSIAIVRANSYITEMRRDYALPLKSLETSSREGRFSINAERQAFRDAALWSEKAWSEIESREGRSKIYLY